VISHKMVAAQFSSSRDVGADCGHQGPMSQQNSYGFGGNELHPQKLVQLVGCRDLNAQNPKAPGCFLFGTRVTATI
jgi:hypothetical protein